MVETGSYDVNRARRDTSFKSFICALLAFLAMLILISLLLFALRNREAGSSTNYGDKSGYDFLNNKNRTKEQNKPDIEETTTEEIISTRLPSTRNEHEFEKIIQSTTEAVTITEEVTTKKEDVIGETTTNVVKEVTTEDRVTSTTTEGSVVIGESDFTTPRKEIVTTPAVPTTCDSGICKRAASVMLATMNHDDKVNKCEDSYKFICEGPEPYDDKAFFQHSFRGFMTKINQVDGKSNTYLKKFADFFKSCNQFGVSINRLERLKYLEGTKGTSLNEVFQKAILSQTLPFFDIGLNIKDNKYILELTLPGLSYLKTTLQDWSLFESIKNDCIEEEADKITQSAVDLGKVRNDIKTCIGEKTKKYVSDFTDEMKQLSALDEYKFLDANVQAALLSNELLEILTTVQGSFTAYRNSKIKESITLGDLKSKYDFGLDWIQLFKDITKDVQIDDSSVIYWSKNLEEVLKKLVEKKANLQQLVDLWYNIEVYKNIVIENKTDKRGQHCLWIDAQLFPDAASVIMSELNADKKELYNNAKEMMKTLRVSTYTSMVNSQMTKESAKIIQDRLSEITLVMPEFTEVEPTNYLGLFSEQDPYPKKLLDSLAHFRKILFSLHDNVVTGETLLPYFVNAFETEPQSYPPSRLVAFQPGFAFGKSVDLPEYVKISKLGMPLARQLAKHFTKYDFEKPLEAREQSIYEKMEKSFDTNYLMKKVNYTVENIGFEIEDSSPGKHLDYDTIFADNMAFRLDTTAFENDKRLDYLPFLKDLNREQTFIIIALQEFCQMNTLVDFIGDYYNGEIPAPLMFRNIVKNSEFYDKAFGCNDSSFERKQFPFINV